MYKNELNESTPLSPKSTASFQKRIDAHESEDDSYALQGYFLRLATEYHQRGAPAPKVI